MDDDSAIILGERGARQARFGAALFDLFVVAWALGGVAALLDPLVPGTTSVLLLWLVLVLVEGVTGRSPGKHVTGLTVQVIGGARDGAERIGVLRAALRRPWGLPTVVMPLGGVATVVGGWTAVVVLLAMLVAIGRSGDGRGFHDRLAGTVVRTGEVDRTARTAVVVTIVVFTLASLVLAATTAPEPAVAATTDAPACVPGGDTVVLDGTVTAEEAQTYLLLPFEVAAGTTRVEVGYSWGDQDPLRAQQPMTATVVDLGLWDADGTSGADAFRGWGGSRQGVLSRDMDPVWVQADSADRGFTPGPVEPGTWHVELGFGHVNDGGGTWHVEIACLDVAVGAPVATDPVDPAHVADPEPGWFHGDFHMHAFHSAPSGPTPAEVVDHARAIGLDFLPITEYVTTQHHGEWGAVARANPDLVVWPGREIITYFGHANVLGETPDVVDYRHGFDPGDGTVTLGDLQRRSVAAGALFQVNHPTLFPDPAFAGFCRGCEFQLLDEIDLDAVHTIEVLTGPVEVGPDYLGLPPGPGIEQPFVATAVQLYEQLLTDGHFVTPVGSSDEKHAEGHGVPATAVFATELSRTALTEGLLAGRSYVRTRGVAGSPAIEVTLTDGTDTVPLGGTLVAEQATLVARVLGGAGQALEVSRNGAPYVTVPIEGDDVTFEVPVARTPDEGPLGTFHRVDVREASGIRSVISGAVFLADAPREGAPDDVDGDDTTTDDGGTTRETVTPPAGAPDAEQDAGSLAATGGGAAAGALAALAVAAGLRRPPRRRPDVRPRGQV